MKLQKMTFKKLAFAISGLALASFANLSNAEVGGMELLERIGQYKGELHTFYAARPSAEQLAQRNKLADAMARVNGIEFLRDKPLQLTETRSALTSSKDPSASFEVDSLTGNFLFNGGMLKYRGDESTANLPQESDLPALADKALAELGLKVDPAQMTIAHIGGLNMSIADGSGKSEIFEKLKTVRLSRSLDGLPVLGDARIILQLGEEGSVAGMIYQWPEIGKSVRLSSESLQKPETIQDAARREIEAKSRKALKAELTTAELVVYDDGQGVMEPAYHFVVKRYFDDGELEPVMIPYDFYIPATTNPAAFFPDMEVAAKAPADGSNTLATRSTGNE